MSNPDFLPAKDQAFLVWALNFTTALVSMLVRIGFPESVFQELMALRNTFSEKLTTAEAPATRTKAAVQAKNNARKAFEKRLRQVIKEYLTYNHALTDEDRDDLGLPIYKTTRTPVPPPTGKADFTIEPLGGSRLVIHFHAHDEERERANAKPFGVRGVEIIWAVLDVPPTSYNELAHSVFDTRSPYTFQFDLADAGKRFYCCLRWENTTGQKGPWSEIQSAIIP